MDVIRTVLVAGATGRLGGIVELLRARGHEVRPMSRRPRDGFVYGDHDDADSLAAAARGADVVFATGTAHRAGPDGELRHGRNLAGAAAAAGARLVYVSGDGAAPDSPLPLFRAKAAVEEHIRARVRHTILAPVYFMENLFNPWNRPHLEAGVFPSPIPIDAPLQQVALADLLALAVEVIEHPRDGERLAVASDEVTAIEAAAALGLEPRHVVPEPLRPLFDWLERVGHGVDIPALHAQFPMVAWHRYGTWAATAR